MSYIQDNEAFSITSIFGVVTTEDGRPVYKANVEEHRSNVTDDSDMRGNFSLYDVSPSPRTPISAFKLLQNGYLYALIGIRVLPNRDNDAGVIPMSFFPFLGSNALSFPSPARSIEEGGVIFEIEENTVLMGIEKDRKQTIFLNRVKQDKLLIELPDGITSSAIAQLVPFGLALKPGGKLTFPNTDHLSQDSNPHLYRLDLNSDSKTLGEYVDVGPVMVEGKNLVTARNAVTETSIYFVAAKTK